MLTLEMLPADQGDCLWIEYTDAGRTRRILIDGGTPSTYPRLKKRIEELPLQQRRFELFVVTHIDSDHIGGAVKLIDDPPEGLTFGDVWFNGFRHLPKPKDELGAKQGEELTGMLVEGKIPWNKAFGGQRIAVVDDEDLPQAKLDGGLTLTALSPGIEQLKKLYPKWEKEMAKLRAEQSEDESRPKPEDELGGALDVAALANSQFKEDKAEPNGSSIALLLEFKNRRLLLGADAHPTVIANNIDRMLSSSGHPVLDLDAYKVAHHGSRSNTSKRLLEKLFCRRYLVSTNGSQFEHPDKESIARIIQFGSEEKDILFNYETDYTTIWHKDSLENSHKYQALFESKLSL
jgi:Predicted hydrolase (metallo-beta-lactamase superfamily)